MSALTAILRRDLRASERSGLHGAARALALGVGALFAVGGFTRFGPSPPDDVHEVFAVGVLALMLLSLVVSLSFSLGAFRAERSAGTLDLLLLSGIGARELALGRSLSQGLVLLSFSAAALPALALFWFFRTPSPGSWLLHLVAVVCWSFTLAAVAVALSAWARRAGAALAGAAVLLPAFLALSLSEAGRETWSAPGLVLLTANEAGAVPASRAFLCLGFHAALFAAAVLLAGLGLEQRRMRVRDEGQAPMKRRKPSDEHPMTWLLQRSSLAARPGLQAAGLAGLLATLGAAALAAGVTPGELVDARVLSAAGGLLALLAFAAAAAVGATRIAGERERRSWESVSSSGRSSERLFGDLLSATVLSCVAPFLFAGALLTAAELRRGVPFADTLSPLAALLVSLVLVGVLGLAASACTRSSAAALALAGVLALAVPAIVAAGHGLAAGSSFPKMAKSLSGFVFVLVLGLPLLVRGVGPFLLLAGAGWRRRRFRVPTPGRLIRVPLMILVPLALVTGAVDGRADQAWAVAFGGLHAAAVHLLTFGEDRSSLSGSVLASGAVWQLLFGLLLFSGLSRHRDTWLGRAAA